MGKPGEPAAIPLNLAGDFGGGSLGKGEVGKRTGRRRGHRGWRELAAGFPPSKFAEYAEVFAKEVIPAFH
jgi:hypothetical protein